MTEFRFPPMKIKALRETSNISDKHSRTHKCNCATARICATTLKPLQDDTRCCENNRLSASGFHPHESLDGGTVRVTIDLCTMFARPKDSLQKSEPAKHLHPLSEILLPSDPVLGWQPSYPPIDCDPWSELKKLTVKFSPWIDFGARERIAAMHADAYVVSKLALRSLDWMAKLDEESRAYYWSWGAQGLEPVWWTPDSTLTNRASLAFWFGPYSSQSFAQIRGTFQRHVALFESGKQYYKEPFLFCGNALAQHLTGETVRICPKFWELGTCDSLPCTPDQWKKRRTTTIFHEWMHGLRPVDDLRDVKAPSSCNSHPSGKCYRDRLFEHNWRFLLGDPRNLVADKRFSEARSNIDNYVSWAFNRFTSLQWRFCDGPIAVSGPGKPAAKK